MINDKPITVYDSGDMEPDWTYVDDTVDGVMAALERPMGYSTINLTVRRFHSSLSSVFMKN